MFTTNQVLVCPEDDICDSWMLERCQVSAASRKRSSYCNVYSHRWASLFYTFNSGLMDYKLLVIT